MAGIDRPTQEDYRSALSDLCGAGCVASLIAGFIESGQCDPKNYGWDLGEAMKLLASTLSDSFCTLNNADVTVKSPKAGES